MDMEKLMKPSEYAQELGISRQAVYAKIKRGILKAKNVEGKLYIVVDNPETKEFKKTTKDTKVNIKAPLKTSPSAIKDYKALLEAKDETISVLKGTVKDLKKSNKQISSTLKGEIDLLKEAFHEMRSLYVLQIQQHKSQMQEVIEVEGTRHEEREESITWISLKKFFKKHKIVKPKEQEKAIKRLNKAFKKSDKRLLNIKGKIKLNAAAEYDDILM